MWHTDSPVCSPTHAYVKGFVDVFIPSHFFTADSDLISFEKTLHVNPLYKYPSRSAALPTDRFYRSHMVISPPARSNTMQNIMHLERRALLIETVPCGIGPVLNRGSVGELPCIQSGAGQSEGGNGNNLPGRSNHSNEKSCNIRPLPDLIRSWYLPLRRGPRASVHRSLSGSGLKIQQSLWDLTDRLLSPVALCYRRATCQVLTSRTWCGFQWFSGFNVLSSRIWNNPETESLIYMHMMPSWNWFSLHASILIVLVWRTELIHTQLNALK